MNRYAIAAGRALSLLPMPLLVPLHAAIALNLMFPFLPDDPEIDAARAAAAWVKALWLGCAAAGMASLVLMFLRPRPAAVATLAFAALAIAAHHALWGEVRPGAWVALAAGALAWVGSMRPPAAPAGASPPPLP